ncbi:uncharacterized protein [Antedon mediterranea]|uniref:uncharacterized protein n=1 Tax=Antedon mediterranea TaxID=105859 RepID=UPI003AF5EBF9
MRLRSENNQIKTRILGPIRIPINERDLTNMMKEAMNALDKVPISPPYRLQDFQQLFDIFPLLSGPLSKLTPENAQVFWDIYGVWLLERRLQRKPNLLPRWPGLPSGAVAQDVQAVTFTTYNRWPRVLWRDIVCTGCFLRRLCCSSHQYCQRHNCMAYATQLLANIETRKRIETRSRCLMRQSDHRKATRRQKKPSVSVRFSRETEVARKLYWE